MKRQEREWLEQVNLVSASDDKNIPASVFMTHAELKKASIQWELLSNFNRLVNTMAYVERASNNVKPTTVVIISFEERAKERAIISKSPQREQFADDIKSLKV